jgi:hypothetical protein
VQHWRAHWKPSTAISPGCGLLVRHRNPIEKSTAGASLLAQVIVGCSQCTQNSAAARSKHYYFTGSAVPTLQTFLLRQVKVFQPGAASVL